MRGVGGRKGINPGLKNESGTVEDRDGDAQGPAVGTGQSAESRYEKRWERECSQEGTGEWKMKKLLAVVTAIFLSATVRADYWMTFCRTPSGQQYSQVGYAKPDADGFVMIKAGPITVVVYKTQVWYQKMPGDAPK